VTRIAQSIILILFYSKKRKQSLFYKYFNEQLEQKMYRNIFISLT